MEEEVNRDAFEEKGYGTFANELPVEDAGEAWPPVRVSYDDVLGQIGEFGKWQQWQILLYSIPPLVSGALFMLGTFTMLEAGDFHCVDKECQHDWMPERTSFQCSHNGSAAVWNDAENKTTGTIDFFECPLEFSDEQIPCEEAKSVWLYDSFEMSQTGVTEWDLVCDKLWVIGMVSSLYMVGLMIGSFIVGYFSDRFGRKPILLGLMILSFLSTLGGGFCQGYLSYAFTRLVTGVAAQGLFILGFSMSIEIVGSKENMPLISWVSYKNLISNFIHIPYALGQAFLTLLAYFFSHWRTLQLAMSVVALMQIISWFFMSESPRWLLTRQKHETYINLLLRASKNNNKKMDTSTLLSLEYYNDFLEEKKEDDKTAKLGFSSLFERPQVILTVTLMLLWPITAMGYYGITLSMSDMGNNAFTSNAMAALLEIPAYFILVALMDKTGRKPLLVFSLLLTSMTCFGAAFADNEALKTTFALLGKLFSASCFSLVYIVTAELNPTSVRTTAIGTCSLMARLGAILAPQLSLVLPSLTPGLPGLHLYIFSGVSFLGSLLALIVPDTVNNSLPENFSEVAQNWVNQKKFWSLM